MARKLSRQSEPFSSAVLSKKHLYLHAWHCHESRESRRPTRLRAERAYARARWTGAGALTRRQTCRRTAPLSCVQCMDTRGDRPRRRLPPPGPLPATWPARARLPLPARMTQTATSRVTLGPVLPYATDAIRLMCPAPPPIRSGRTHSSISVRAARPSAPWSLGQQSSWVRIMCLD